MLRRLASVEPPSTLEDVYVIEWNQLKKFREQSLQMCLMSKVGRPFPAPASFSGTHFLKEFSKDFQRKY